MNNEKKYVAPQSDGIIKRFFKIVFKTPYGQLPMGQKTLKLIVQLAIAAAIVYVAYIILKVIITIIIAIVALILVVMGLFESDKELYVVDKRGNKERYHKY
jgi:ABC-type multidrug transport system permease subunit